MLYNAIKKWLLNNKPAAMFLTLVAVYIGFFIMHDRASKNTIPTTLTTSEYQANASIEEFNRTHHYSKPSDTARNARSLPSSEHPDEFPCTLDTSYTYGGVSLSIDKSWQVSEDAGYYAYLETQSDSPEVFTQVNKITMCIATCTQDETADATNAVQRYTKNEAYYKPTTFSLIKNWEKDGVTYSQFFTQTKGKTVTSLEVSSCELRMFLVGHAANGTGFIFDMTIHTNAHPTTVWESHQGSVQKVIDGIRFNPSAIMHDYYREECKIRYPSFAYDADPASLFEGYDNVDDFADDMVDSGEFTDREDAEYFWYDYHND